jgi:hypothetical protein
LPIGGRHEEIAGQRTALVGDRDSLGRRIEQAYVRVEAAPVRGENRAEKLVAFLDPVDGTERGRVVGGGPQVGIPGADQVPARLRRRGNGLDPPGQLLPVRDPAGVVTIGDRGYRGQHLPHVSAAVVNLPENVAGLEFKCLVGKKQL